MASTRKRPSSDLEARVAAIARDVLPPGCRVVIALSGGLDSVVLLDLLARLAPRLELRLACLHVHHGISPNADAWARFARRAARRYRIPCRVVRIDLAPHRHLGLEGAARRARYAAFAAVDADAVALAHHRDDQAETLLLQLARGAGVVGLAGMPRVRTPREGPTIVRPLLDVSRAELERHARAHGLEWVEDESNADIGLARNLIRHRVIPLLERVNPAVTANLARGAAHLAEARELLDALGALDAGGAEAAESLPVSALSTLGEARARNVLRWWLASLGVAVPSAERLRETLRQAIAARADGSVCGRFGTFEVRRFRNRLFVVARRPAVDAAFAARWNGRRAWPLAELGGVLRLEPSRGAGLSRAKVVAEGATVRVRTGGERFRVAADRPRRALKNLLQEREIPPWERERLPLLYVGERLAFIPGVGCAPECAARPGEAGIVPRWCPAESATGDAPGRRLARPAKGVIK